MDIHVFAVICFASSGVELLLSDFEGEWGVGSIAGVSDVHVQFD